VGTQLGRMFSDGPGHVRNLGSMHMLCDVRICREDPMAQFAQIALCLLPMRKVMFPMDVMRGMAFDQMNQRHGCTKLLSELSGYRQRSLREARTVEWDD